MFASLKILFMARNGCEKEMMYLKRVGGKWIVIRSGRVREFSTISQAIGYAFKT